jgi:hypothetical protein
MHNGNYPFAPQRDAATFGPVGLLGAIGRWAHEAGQTAWADRVLQSIAGRPLYIVSYDSVTQAQFDHHAVGLARADKLSQIVNGLTFGTRLTSEIEDDRPIWSDPKRELFHRSASRFLQLFSEPAFCDFAAARATYPPETRILFEEYFMNQRRIEPPIVHAAGALGQWLNRVAYFAADADVKQNVTNRPREVRAAKAKIIVTLESAAMSARDSLAMISQVMTQAARLGQGDAPAEAKPFIDAAMTGDLEPDDARHLLMTYMRLRSISNSGQEPNGHSDNVTVDTDEQIEEIS